MGGSKGGGGERGEGRHAGKKCFASSHSPPFFFVPLSPFPFSSFSFLGGRELTDPRFPRCGCDSKIVTKKGKSSFREKCFNVSFLPFLLSFFLSFLLRFREAEKWGRRGEQKRNPPHPPPPHSLAPFPRQQRTQPQPSFFFFFRASNSSPQKKISEKHPRPRFFVHAREEEDGAEHGGGEK